MAAVDRGDRTKAQIAVDFDVCERQVYKLLALRREQGTLQPKGHGSGNPGKVEAKHRRLLERLISKQPDATLQELRDELHARSGLFVSITTLWQMCRDLDLSVKKKSPLASEACDDERRAFAERQKSFFSGDLIFIDEFGVNRAMARRYARFKSGTRAFVRQPFVRGANTSVIAAMSRDGVIASMMIQGTFNREAVAAFIREFVLPLMTRHSNIVWDNARIHTDVELIEQIERCAGRVEFLPAYSPDFNPIEHCISKVKAILRRLCARTDRALRKALKTAFKVVRPKDMQGWFEHCGYAYS